MAPTSAVTPKPLAALHHIFITHVLASAQHFLHQRAQVFPARAEKVFEAVAQQSLIPPA
jgi:hypothetical protein